MSSLNLFSVVSHLRGAFEFVNDEFSKHAYLTKGGSILIAVASTSFAFSCASSRAKWFTIPLTFFNGYSKLLFSIGSIAAIHS